MPDFKHFDRTDIAITSLVPMFKTVKEPEAGNRGQQGNNAAPADPLDEPRMSAIAKGMVTACFARTNGDAPAVIDRDRSAHLIISGSVNICPVEIEAVMITHPEVGDVGVIGMPNEEWGEEVKAVIELQPGIKGSAELAATARQWQAVQEGSARRLSSCRDERGWGCCGEGGGELMPFAPAAMQKYHRDALDFSVASPRWQASGRKGTSAHRFAGAAWSKQTVERVCRLLRRRGQSETKATE